MQLDAPHLDIYVPDGTATEAALRRTTHLAIAAHADDLELMAAEGILTCFDSTERWFTGVVVTDGTGGPRTAQTGALDPNEVRRRRASEQRRAAELGAYSAVIQLGFSSDAIKRRDALDCERAINAFVEILERAPPEVLYTHDLTDKHDTHVAVALRVIEACRRLPLQARPARVIGCEVWRGLDWLVDSDKVLMPLDDREELQLALIATFSSQIQDGKRYDLGALGRRRANATFSESHHNDRHRGLAFGSDLTPLLESGNPEALITARINNLKSEILTRLNRLT